ncbi:MAG: hypothetical protein LLF94_05830 [Chlamydiales bacterium]|nr:hypothetical protein [Chlamydiales bacterium]
MNTNHEKIPFSRDTWAEWLMLNSKLVAILSACVLVALIGGVWALNNSSAQKFKDFETADVLAEELQKTSKIFDDKTGSQSNEQALASLKTLTDEYAILQPRFDSLIAEEMLIANKGKEIDPYAKRTIARLKSLGLTDFADFSEVSRLSGLHEYKDALREATALKGRLAAKSKSDVSDHQYLLEGFLLLHIATLNQKLGNHEAMVQSIMELKEYLGLSKRATPLTPHEKELASQMLAHLQDRQSSLLEFIQEMPQTAGA